MSDEHKSLFLAAVQHFYKDFKKQGGTQQKLAVELGVTQSYLSSILSGSRSSSLDLQIQIANRLYGSFDKFLAAGRNIIEGRLPHEHKVDPPPDDAETLLAHLAHYVVHKQHIEKQLQISEEKFKDICLTSGDMVYEMDADLKITYITGKVKEVYGREPEEVIGRKPFEFIAADELESIMTAVDDAVRNRTIFNIVIPDIDKKKFRNTIGKPLYSKKSGEFIGFRGVSKDITERVNLANERNEYEWLLESALDAMGDTGIVILDKKNRILKCNKCYEEVSIYPQEVRETYDVHKYFEYMKDKLDNPEDFFEGMKEDLETLEEITHYFKFKNGKTIKRRIQPIKKDGMFAGRIIFLQDVTTD